MVRDRNGGGVSLGERCGALNRAALPQETAGRKKNWKKAALCVGATALASVSLYAGAAYQQANEMTGTHGVSAPLNGPVQTEQNIDTKTVVISFNTNKKVPELSEEIQAMGEKYEADAILLQEVRYADLWRLQSLPGWYVTHMVAEGVKHGGLMNAILTKQEPKNVKTASFAGRSLRLAAAGTMTGSVTPTPRSFDNAWQENRGMISLEIMALAWNRQEMKYEAKPTKIITTHIAGAGKNDPKQEEVHQRQFLEFSKMLKDEVEEGKPVIGGADVNAYFEEVLDKVGSHGLQVYQPGETTMVNAEHEVNDYFAARGGGVLGMGAVEVIKKPLTTKEHVSDHLAIKIVFDGEQTRKLEGVE